MWVISKGLNMTLWYKQLESCGGIYWLKLEWRSSRVWGGVGPRFRRAPHWSLMLMLASSKLVIIFSLILCFISEAQWDTVASTHTWLYLLLISASLRWVISRYTSPAQLCPTHPTSDLWVLPSHCTNSPNGFPGPAYIQILTKTQHGGLTILTVLRH